jgi:hypothetical protein
MNTPDDQWNNDHDPTGHESDHDRLEPPTDDFVDADATSLFDDDYHGGLSPALPLDDSGYPATESGESGAGVQHHHPPPSIEADAVPGPLMGPAIDPFAAQEPHTEIGDPLHPGPPLPDETAIPDDDAFAQALATDYTATWTAEPADHSPPVFDPQTSARLADLAPQPSGGVDVALAPHSQGAQAAALWHETLPGEPLPVGEGGRVLDPAALLDELIGRIDDPAQADVARAVRESLA